MESSNISDQRENRLENSETITVKLNADETGLSGEKCELKGSFTLTCSSDQSLENEDYIESDGDKLEKSLTLSVCCPPSNSKNEISEDTLVQKQGECQEAKRAQKTKPLAQSADELATIDEEKPVVSCGDIVIIPTDNETDVGVRKNSLETNDNKRVTNPTASEKRVSLNNNSLKTQKNLLCDPVVELGKTVGNIESVNRNNKVEDGHRRAVPLSSPATGIKASTVAVPVESNKECRHSTGEVVSKNKIILSLDNSTKGTQSGRIDTQKTQINHKANRLPTFNNTDDRTSNNKKCNRRKSVGAVTNDNVTTNVRVRKTRCHSSHGERKSSANLQYKQNSTISRSYDKSVNTLGSQNSLSSSERQRPASVFEQRYTTRELRRALPRRSFFNCHEKAMKDAGFETDDPEKKRKAERLKARLERIANEFSPLPSARNKPDINDTQGLINGVVNITINDGNDITTEGDDRIEESDSLDTNVTSDKWTDFSNSKEESSSKHDTSKLLVKPTHKKRPGSARQEHIDCKPLLQYLEYVKDNRDEYLHHNHTHYTKSNPSSRLISLGKAFELRHLGGVPKRLDDDVIVMAAKALRPRCSDPAKYTKIERDKSGTHRGQDTLRQARPPSEDKRKQESHAKDEEHSKSELEKKRIRAEEWTKSVSTNTLTKAKIQSLRELGADDVEIMKWWDAFKSCRYLRDTGPVEEKTF